MDIRSLARLSTALALAAALAACGRSDPASLIASARNYLAKGDAPAAIIELKNALQTAPENPDARFLLARSLLDTGDVAGAETEARKAIQLGYAPDEVYPVLARALLQQGEAAARRGTRRQVAHESPGQRRRAGVRGPRAARWATARRPVQRSTPRWP
jgi:Flp pilus assembly protein TadD